MSFRSLSVHAASVGAIDFTSAAHWAARGADVSAFVNTGKISTPILSNAKFDAVAGLPTGLLARSADGRFRTIYTRVDEHGIEGIVHNVATEISKVVPEATELLATRAKRLAQKAAALPTNIDWRIRILRAVYQLLDLDIKVSELSDTVAKRDGEWLVSNLQGISQHSVKKYQSFLRGGRIEHTSVPGVTIYTGVAPDSSGVVSASLGPDLAVPAADVAKWKAGSIRLRGSLDLLYGVDTESAAGHLPWHSRADIQIAPAPVYEIVSPPCRVMPCTKRLSPSGYALHEYGGLAHDYAQRLIGSDYWNNAFALILADIHPVREKFSQSQRGARRLALQALSDSNTAGLLSECAIVWRHCRILLSEKNEPRNEEINKLTKGVATVASVVNNMLLSVNLADFEVNNVSLSLLKRSLKQATSGDSLRDRTNSLKRACEHASELLLGAAMLVYEATLRADIVRIYLLCGSACVFTALQSRRNREEYLAWQPAVVQNKSAN